MSEFEFKPVASESGTSLREELRLRELLAGLDTFIVGADDDDEEDWDEEDDWDDDDDDEDWEDDDEDEDEDWDEDD